MTLTATPTTPTQLWLAQVADYMPPLSGPAGTAERLVLLLHYSIDWDTSWVSSYRTTYWDKILPDRIMVASQQASNLRSWWTALADDLGASPTTRDSRQELATLLDVENPLAVLRCLSEETLALVMRARIVAEARRQQRR